MIKAITLGLGAILALGTATSAAGATASKVNRPTDYPLAMQKLPHPPTFTPKSGQANIIQTFVLKHWLYKVCYVYNPHGGGWPTGKGWRIWGYKATRIQRRNGKPIETSKQGANSDSSSFCTPLKPGDKAGSNK